VFSERINEGKKTHPECGRHHPIVWEAEFKGDRQTNSSVEEISRQPSIQTVAWVFWVSFGQVDRTVSKNVRNRKMCKTCNAVRKSHLKLGFRKPCFLKRITPLKRSQALCIRTIGKCFEGILGIGQDPAITNSRV
jgi:hypothetical protein